MDLTTNKTPTATQSNRNGTNGKTAPVAEAQGYSISIFSRLEALVGAPDGKTWIVSASIDVVTPEIAAVYLAKMRPNRRVAERAVEKLVRALDASKFRITNQGIGFDSDGYLIDGQHRCAAIIKSGQPAAMLVVRGLPTETQNVVDANRVRGAGDQFNITFGAKDGKQRMAVARVLNLLRTGWMGAHDALSNEEQFEFARQFTREIDWAILALGARRRIAPAPVMAAWAYAYGADPSIATWAESYVEGSGLTKGDPLLMLREVAVESFGWSGSSGRMEASLKALRALWAKRNNEPIRRIYASAEGLLGFASLRGDDIASAWDWYRSR